MGLFGLFGGDKPTEKSIAKQVTKVKERYAQPEYRRVAMETLLDWGTPDALDGVLARFTVVVQSPHWDEEEKRWLVEELAERGEPAIEALRRFLKTSNNIGFAARAMERLVDKEQFRDELAAALQARDPEDYRSVQGKQELVAALGETEDPKVVEVVMPYVDDHSDDVQVTAVEVIERLGNEEQQQKLVAILGEDFRSARVARAAAGAVSRLKLPIDPEKPLSASVMEDYSVKDGTLVSNR